MKLNELLSLLGGDDMSHAQLHLFEPTLLERIEDLVQEPIDKFVIFKSVNLQEGKYHYLKAMSKKKIYDVSISESFEYPSVINAVYEKRKNSRVIELVFGNGKISW